MVVEAAAQKVWRPTESLKNLAHSDILTLIDKIEIELGNSQELRSSLELMNSRCLTCLNCLISPWRSSAAHGKRHMGRTTLC